MELREFIDIFVRQRRLFFSVVSGFIIVGACWYGFQPISYQADLTLNVARHGIQQTSEYRYDGFYRLQADERFADTVVRWLASPRIVEDIDTQAKSVPLNSRPFSFGAAFDARRLSSQVIDVAYRTSDRESADRLARAMIVRVNQETDRLNGQSTDQSWFVIQGNQPVVVDGRQGLAVTLIISTALGCFFGFWVVLIHWYLRPKDGKR